MKYKRLKEKWRKESATKKGGTRKGWAQRKEQRKAFFLEERLFILACVCSVYTRHVLGEEQSLSLSFKIEKKKERRFGGRGYSQQRWILKMTIGRHYTWSVKSMGCVVNFSLNAHQPQSMRGTILRIFNDLRIVKHIMHTYFTIFFIKKRFSHFRKTAF